MEIPRHVHKRSGESKIVRSQDELDEAVAEGWLVDPNAPEQEPEPATTDEPKRGPGRPRKP